MSRSFIRIGNGQAFWGDSALAPCRLIHQQPDLDYLTLDYLAELSLSILAAQKAKDSTAGYAKDFLDLLRSIVPFWKGGSKVKIVSNAGGLNPLSCAEASLELLSQLDCPHLHIGVVTGDDVLAELRKDHANPLFTHLDTQAPLASILPQLTTANVYVGARSIAEALEQGADIVITGRIADPSLTVGPCVAHFNWSWADYDRLANATVAGHLIECGTQVTGGISTDWLKLPDGAHLGYPVVEVSSDGTFVITKPPHTGGSVSLATVKEQLLYELGNPDEYLSPDVIVSILSLELKQVGLNRVHISGSSGRPPPSTYKVSASYSNGFRSEGYLALFGIDVVKKARLCGEYLLTRLKEAGYAPKEWHVDVIGSGDIAPGIVSEPSPLYECMLRMAAADPRREVVELFSREIASFVTCGPSGVTGYATGRPPVRSVYGFWPCLISRESVKTSVQMLKNRERS